MSDLSFLIVALQTKRSVPNYKTMAELREHIVNTALKAFLQKGFKEVTMKELVENARVSKGAFYHYFTSKEQVFGEVVLTFYKSLQIGSYDALSTTSLLEFYQNWISRFSDADGLPDASALNKPEYSPNHYYLIFDGIRLIPAFKELFDKEQHQEMRAWTSIIETAQKSGEISTRLSAEQVAKLFMYSSDGSVTKLLTQNKISDVKKEVSESWNSLYTLLKA
jgi:TetR/AcrR family transcriptional repressor of nem operon